MDSVTIIIFLLLSIALFVLVFKQFKNNSVSNKPTALTKEEIILGYEKLVLDVVEKNKDNKDILLEKKSQLLKYISKDLHNNIFFDEKEAKEIIKRLASL